MSNFEFNETSCHPIDFDALQKGVIETLHIEKLANGSIVTSTIANNIAIVNVFNGAKMTAWALPLNRLDVLLTNALHNGTDSVTLNDVNIELVKFSDYLYLRFDGHELSLPVSYWNYLQSQYIDPVKVAVKNKHFKFVGTMEQGGYLCPKCGCCNNAYTFNGTCEACGY